MSRYKYKRMKRTKIKVDSIIFYSLCILGGIFIAWVFASWIDIIAHNLTTYQYANWNFFSWFLRVVGILNPNFVY